MRLRLIRNATLHVWLAGKCLLVDPMLDPAGARPPVEDTADPRRNPLVDLPEPAEVVVTGLDAAIVTHLHRDHLDDTAIELLPSGLPLFAQPEDVDRLRGHGFTDIRPVEEELDWD
jgi:L-ascorbate metabolism protein UlaG (beta-lactamase superfamily)